MSKPIQQLWAAFDEDGNMIEKPYRSQGPATFVANDMKLRIERFLRDGTNSYLGDGVYISAFKDQRKFYVRRLDLDWSVAELVKTVEVKAPQPDPYEMS